MSGGIPGATAITFEALEFPPLSRLLSDGSGVRVDAREGRAITGCCKLVLRVVAKFLIGSEARRLDAGNEPSGRVPVEREMGIGIIDNL